MAMAEAFRKGHLATASRRSDAAASRRAGSISRDHLVADCRSLPCSRPSLVAARSLPTPLPEQVELLKTFRDEFVADHARRRQVPQDRRRARRSKPAEVTLPTLPIAKYEVPQNLWEAVMGSNPSRWKGQRNSVEMLSLDEAQAVLRARRPS